MITLTILLTYLRRDIIKNPRKKRCNRSQKNQKSWKPKNCRKPQKLQNPQKFWKLNRPKNLTLDVSGLILVKKALEVIHNP